MLKPDEIPTIVIFYASRTLSVLDEPQISESRKTGSVNVFSKKVDDRVLTFRKDPEGFVYEQSDSTWSITGNCLTGHMKDKNHRPMVHGNPFAFTWFAFHPYSEGYK